MKRPKPRDYGLDSDHPTSYAFTLPADPAQPFTQEELHTALDRLVFAEALRARQAKYKGAVDLHDWGVATR